MSTIRRQPKNLSVTGCLWSIVLIALIIFSLSWNGQQPPMTSDVEMVEQWQTSKSQWLDVIAECDRARNTDDLATYDLSERYDQTDKLIALGSLADFTGCEVQSIASERFNDFYHVAQNGQAFLLVSDQRRKGTGWIEEKASLWSGGWVSWKSAILEEKGFLYTRQGALEDTISPLPIAAEITTEPLDQFVGKYRGTSQISGNSSCELWKLRPIGVETIRSEVDNALNQSTWYLFYHQARECPS